MNNNLDDNPFADVMVSAAKSLKRTIFRKILPLLILATIGSFVLGFILGAIIF